MLKHERVKTLQGDDIEVVAETVCLHGDGEHAAKFASALRKGLEEAGVRLQPQASIQERFAKQATSYGFPAEGGHHVN